MLLWVKDAIWFAVRFLSCLASYYTESSSQFKPLLPRSKESIEGLLRIFSITGGVGNGNGVGAYSFFISFSFLLFMGISKYFIPKAFNCSGIPFFERVYMPVSHGLFLTNIHKSLSTFNG